MKEAKEVKKITVSSIFSWLFGIFFIITGLALMRDSVIIGSLIIICSIMILPYFNKLSRQKLHFEISKGVKFLLVIVIFLLIGIAYNIDGKSSEKTTPKLDCSKCPQTECLDVDCSECLGQIKTETVTKYQCADGSVKDKLSDCPLIEEEQEIETLSEYDSSKHLINKKLTRDSFQFTVTYAGFSGNDYKVEFEVKNIGSEAEYFQPSATAILDSNKNQYDVVKYHSKYPVSAGSETILPKVTKKGWWLFENVPKNSGIGTFTFQIGFIDKEVFSFEVPLN